MAEILTEVMGKLIAAPSKTRAGRRTVGLPPFVVRELEAHLAVAQRPSGHVFTAPGGGSLRVPRRTPCAGHTSVSLTLDRYGHQTIPGRSRGAIQ